MELKLVKANIREAVLDDRKADRAVEAALAQKLEAVRKVGQCLNEFAISQGADLAKAVGKGAGLSEPAIRQYMGFARKNPDKVTASNYRDSMATAATMVRAAQPVLHGRNGSREPQPGERGYPDPDPRYDHMCWCEEVRELALKIAEKTNTYLKEKPIATWSVEECEFYMSALHHAAALYQGARHQRLQKAGNT
jgi:hypothetical protein